MSRESLVSSMDIFPLNLPLNEPFSIASGQQEKVKNVLVKITLSNGIIGLGEAAPFPAVSGETQESTISALEKINEEVVRSDIRNWKNISDKISLKLHKNPAALCGVQMALVDAFCKSINISAATLFGGASTTLKTDMTITASDEDHAERSARAIVARGINTIKIKTSGQDINFDFKRIKRIKDAVPNAEITIDGNCGYSLKGAFELIEMLEKERIPLLFFEQPFPRDQWKAMAQFTKESGVKVAADESARTAKDVLKIVGDQSAHIINIKLMKSGLFEAIKMVEIAKAAGLELMIGGMVETILSMTFSAHFATGTGGFKYADLDTPLFIKEHPFVGGFNLNGDIITIDSDKSGLGVSLLNKK